MGFENIPAFIGAGYAAPLGIPDINEFAEEQVKIVTRENKVYAVPWFVSVMGYYYNKKLFREAGLDPENPPRTLDELVEQLPAFELAEGQGAPPDEVEVVIAMSGAARRAPGAADWGALETDLSL